MTENIQEQLNEFLNKFDSFNTEGKGLNQEQFVSLYADLGGIRLSKSAGEHLFRGVDVDGSGLMTKDEFSKMAKAIIDDDDLYTSKVLFRSLDKDRSNALDSNEISKLASFLNSDLDSSSILANITSMTGSETGTLNFSQIYTLVTKKVLKNEVDPYDGTNPKSSTQSKCCLLI